MQKKRKIRQDSLLPSMKVNRHIQGFRSKHIDFSYSEHVITVNTKSSIPSGFVIIVQVLHPSYHTKQLWSPISGRVNFGFSVCITLLSNMPTVKRIKNRITGNIINFLDSLFLRKIHCNHRRNDFCSQWCSSAIIMIGV